MRAAEASQGRATTLGWIKRHTDGQWHLSTETHKHQAAYYALLEVARRDLQLTHCWAGVIARGVQKLPPCRTHCSSTVVLHWLTDERDNVYTAHFQHSDSVNVSTELGHERLWNRVSLIQFYLLETTDTTTSDGSTITSDDNVDHMPGRVDIRTGYDNQAHTHLRC